MNTTLLLMQGSVGLVLGCRYILLAMGLSIIFGMLGVVNFAHGAFYMLGAYASYAISSTFLGFWPSLIIAPIIVGSIGMLIEYLFVSPLYKRELLYTLLLTFAFSLIFPDTVRFIFGLGGKSMSLPFGLRGVVNIGYMFMPKYRIFILVLTVVVIIAIWLLLEKTKLGMIIRAGMDDNTMVEAMGVDVSKIWTTVFGLGVGLAALAGVISGPISRVNPSMGINVVITSFVIVVIGGLGSLKGAILGGLIVGEVVAFSTLYFGEAGEVVMYLLMALVLLLRPQGLFGTAEA